MSWLYKILVLNRSYLECYELWGMLMMNSKHFIQQPQQEVVWWWIIIFLKENHHAETTVYEHFVYRSCVNRLSDNSDSKESLKVVTSNQINWRELWLMAFHNINKMFTQKISQTQYTNIIQVNCVNEDDKFIGVWPSPCVLLFSLEFEYNQEQYYAYHFWGTNNFSFNLIFFSNAL